MQIIEILAQIIAASAAVATAVFSGKIWLDLKRQRISDAKADHFFAHLRVASKDDPYMQWIFDVGTREYFLAEILFKQNRLFRLMPNTYSLWDGKHHFTD